MPYVFLKGLSKIWIVVLIHLLVKALVGCDVISLFLSPFADMILNNIDSTPIQLTNIII